MAGIVVVSGCALLAVPALLAQDSASQPPAESPAEAAADTVDPRAGELGILLEGRPGPLDAITDVGGVEVGHATLVRGQGRLVPGEGPVRTGVTAVFPRDPDGRDAGASTRSAPPGPGRAPGRALDGGSILVVIATDAPLLPIQLRRLAERAGVGIARMGGVGSNSSGDLFLAFSTANRRAAGSADSARATVLANHRLSPLFEAAARATAESILNALLAAETMTGVDGYRVPELPEEELVEILRGPRGPELP